MEFQLKILLFKLVLKVLRFQTSNPRYIVIVKLITKTSSKLRYSGITLFKIIFIRSVGFNETWWASGGKFLVLMVSRNFVLEEIVKLAKLKL